MCEREKIRDGVYMHVCMCVYVYVCNIYIYIYIYICSDDERERVFMWTSKISKHGETLPITLSQCVPISTDRWIKQNISPRLKSCKINYVVVRSRNAAAVYGRGHRGGRRGPRCTREYEEPFQRHFPLLIIEC